MVLGIEFGLAAHKKLSTGSIFLAHFSFQLLTLLHLPFFQSLSVCISIFVFFSSSLLDTHMFSTLI